MEAAHTGKKKITKLWTWDRPTLWYVNFTSIKLFKISVFPSLQMFLFGTRTKTGSHVLCIGPISQPHAVRNARTGTLQTGGLETGFQCVEGGVGGEGISGGQLEEGH